ncbi:MAG: ThuA domain-containing protein [Actinobacteria bacterium]|nr:ThuA domain-containing protein [Actinomycetota bacterium]
MSVTVWSEGLEQQAPEANRVYPDGIHEAIAAALRVELGEAALVRTATLDGSEHGLSSEVLEATDVLAWWGHRAHEAVDDAVAERVVQQVLDGMGLLVLHSSHLSKPFLRLMGTRCSLRWRNDADREVVWTVAPAHPIAEGLPPAIVIPEHEMYGEYFDIPPPEELVFISSFGGGVFRSGCCWTRGKGRIFYFSPGHETFPVYRQPEVKRVLANGVRWARRRSSSIETASSPNSPSGWFEA